MKKIVLVLAFAFLVISLPIFGQESRHVECDLCGYCQDKPVPQNWEKCRLCLYPNANPTPDSKSTLLINEDTNQAPTPVKGSYFTQLGCIATNPVQGEGSERAAGGFVNFLLTKVVFQAVGGIAFMYLIWGAFLLATSQSDPERLNTGKKTVTGALVGLVFTLFSLFLVNLIANNVLKIPGFSSNQASQQNQANGNPPGEARRLTNPLLNQMPTGGGNSATKFDTNPAIKCQSQTFTAPQNSTLSTIEICAKEVAPGSIAKVSMNGQARDLLGTSIPVINANLACGKASTGVGSLHRYAFISPITLTANGQYKIAFEGPIQCEYNTASTYAAGQLQLTTGAGSSDASFALYSPQPSSPQTGATNTPTPTRVASPTPTPTFTPTPTPWVGIQTGSLPRGTTTTINVFAPDCMSQTFKATGNWQVKNIEICAKGVNLTTSKIELRKFDAIGGESVLDTSGAPVNTGVLCDSLGSSGATYYRYSSPQNTTKALISGQPYKMMLNPGTYVPGSFTPGLSCLYTSANTYFDGVLVVNNKQAELSHDAFFRIDAWGSTTPADFSLGTGPVISSPTPTPTQALCLPCGGVCCTGSCVTTATGQVCRTNSEAM